MSEYEQYLSCEHDWSSGPRQWPVICFNCNQTKSDIEWMTKVADLEAQRDELLAACEVAKERLFCICATHRHLCAADTIRELDSAIEKAKGATNE